MLSAPPVCASRSHRPQAVPTRSPPRCSGQRVPILVDRVAVCSPGRPSLTGTPQEPGPEHGHSVRAHARPTETAGGGQTLSIAAANALAPTRLRVRVMRADLSPVATHRPMGVRFGRRCCVVALPCGLIGRMMSAGYPCRAISVAQIRRAACTSWRDPRNGTTRPATAHQPRPLVETSREDAGETARVAGPSALRRTCFTQGVSE